MRMAFFARAMGLLWVSLHWVFPVAAQTTPLRLNYPQSAGGSGAGWSVSPSTGTLGWTLPIGVVPGDIPVPVVYRYQASMTSDVATGVTYTRYPDGTSIPRYFSVTRHRGIWSTLNFGFISPARNLAFGLAEEGTQVLEDGTLFRDSDWATQAGDGSSLPLAFGLNAPSGGYVTDGSGRFGLYSASLADLGSWSTKVSQLTPTNQFRVLMDRNRARIYGYHVTLRAYVPILWVDRFQHWVTFQWQQSTWSGVNTFTVQVKNPSGLGVQLSWAAQNSPTSVVDLLRADFIGIPSPSILVRGYTGPASLLPSSMTPTGTLMQVPLAVGGPVGRPTLVRVAAPGSLPVPGFVPSVPSAPAVPAAPEVDWTFGYSDPNLAELGTLQDPLGVTTTFTFQSYAFPNNAPLLRGVSAASSVDGATGVVLSQNWSRVVPATVGGVWTVTATTGYSDGQATETRSTILSYPGSGVGYTEGALKSIQIQGTTNSQTTAYDLSTMGADGSLTTPGNAHITITGKPNTDFLQTLDTVTGNVTGQTLQVNGAAVQTSTLTYNSEPKFLDPNQPATATVTRSGLPAVQNVCSYSPQGLPTRRTTKVGEHEKGQTFSYDGNGRLNGIGLVATWASDTSLAQTYTPSSFGPTALTTSGTNINPSLSETWTYDAAGRVASHMNVQGYTTSYTFDLRGRPLTVSTPGTPTLSYSYPTERSRSWSQGRLSGSERYDGFGRLQSRTRGDGVTETYTTDIYGRVVAVKEINGNISRTVKVMAYDALDRVISEQPASGPGRSYAYSSSGINQVVTITATNGLTFSQTLDPWGQTVASTDPAGTTTQTTYNEFGQATQVVQTEPGGKTQTRSFSYDGIGKLTSRTEPETKTTTFANFTAQGQPTTVTDATGRVLTGTYDALGRMRSLSNGGVSLTNTYSGALLMSASSSDGISQSFTYDGPGGRMDSESLTVDGVKRTMGYAYDGYGTLATVTYPSERAVGYTYDSLNRVYQIRNNGVTLATVGYDGWGNQTSLLFASGAESAWIPDTFGLHLQTWNVTYAGGTDSRSYAFDGSDHLQTAGEWTLQHDSLGRLQTTSGFGFSTAHGYDGFGNNITHTASGSLPGTLNQFGFSVLTDNRIPGIQINGGMTGWSVKNNGEANQIGTGVNTNRYLNFGWDNLGRVSSVTDSQTGAVQTYRYAPSGMRVSLMDSSASSRNRRFLTTNGGLLLGEYLSSGTWKRDVIYLGSQAIAEVDGSGIHELHADHLGTPRVITAGASGAVEGRQAFGAYGELIGTSTSGYQPLTGYTGHVQTDATGLIYMRGRYYSSAWHRFVNSDQGADAASWNQMAYVGGSPFHAIDPSGMTEVGAKHLTPEGWWEYWNGSGWVLSGGFGFVEVIDHLTNIAGADVSYPAWMNTTSNFGGFRQMFSRGGPGSAKPQTPQPEYDSPDQAAKCAFWKMLQALKAKGNLASVLSGKLEYGGRLLTNRNGSFSYTGFTSWNPDRPQRGVGMSQISIPAGWSSAGNYHTHTSSGSLGWGFSDADLDRSRNGVSKSSTIYSSIVTPDRNGSTLLGWYPPGQQYPMSYQNWTTKIDGKGCK